MNPTSDELQTLAQRRADIRIGFLGHLAVFVAVNLGLALFHALAIGHFQLPYPVWGWGAGLLAHGFGTWVSLSGPGLRERLVAAELAALRQR